MKKFAWILLFLVTAATSLGQSQGNFINVEGPDLKSRLATAVKRGSAQRGRFWVAYTFAVKPGLAFDAVYTGHRGSAISINSKTANSQIETRNLGLFLLHENAGGTIARVEIYNLDRPRDYSGYPVYWLDRAPGNESLPLLRSLIETVTPNENVERLTDAIGAHDETQVPTVLRDIVRNAKSDRARVTAISWLGHLPAQTDFLAAFVRDERELITVRREAAEAIGDSPDRNALRVLQDLYRAVTHREVKRELLEAISDDGVEADALRFLVDTVQREPDRVLQHDAIEAIAEAETSDATAALQQLFSGTNQREVKEKIVEAMEEAADRQSAIRFLVGVARNDSDRKVRERALDALGDMHDERGVDALAQLYDVAGDEVTKYEILDALGDAESIQALQKLMAVAQRDSSIRLRRRAIALLGESEDPVAFKFLEELIK